MPDEKNVQSKKKTEWEETRDAANEADVASSPALQSGALTGKSDDEDDVSGNT